MLCQRYSYDSCVHHLVDKISPEKKGHSFECTFRFEGNFGSFEKMVKRFEEVSKQTCLNNWEKLEKSKTINFSLQLFVFL